ncbi:hypothetical protein N9F76_01385 [bacterium]|nr:hypothetical protein [bacterium]
MPQRDTGPEPLEPRAAAESTTNPSESGLLHATNRTNPLVNDETSESSPATTATDEPTTEKTAALPSTETTLDGTGEATLDGTGETTLDGTGEATLDGTGEATLDGTGEATASEVATTETATLDTNHLYSENTNPFSQPLLQDSVVAEPSSPYINANEISHKEFAKRSSIIIVPCSSLDLFKTTWAIMLDRGLSLIASMLFCVFLVAITFVMGSIVSWILILFINDMAMSITYYTGYIIISTITTIGLCRNAIGVARNTPHLMSESSITFRSLINTLVPVALFITVASYYKWALLTTYAIDTTVLVLLGLCTVGTIGWLWSSIFLCCDMQCSGFKSLFMAARIFYRNKLSTLALISASTTLILLGVMSYGILLIVALPFVQLLLATSYLMMTNQPLATPEHSTSAD